LHWGKSPEEGSFSSENSVKQWVATNSCALVGSPQPMFLLQLNVKGGKNALRKYKKLSQTKKLSQEALAEEMNVSRQAVSKWENGLSEPSTDNLMKLTEIFDTDIEVLLTGEQNITTTETEKKKRQKNRLVNLSIIGYALVGITVNGLYGYYFPNEDATFWQWLITALIGGSLLGYKNYHLPMEKKMKASGLDALYIFFLFFIASVPLPGNLQLLLVAVFGGVLIVPLLRYSLDPWKNKT